MKTERIVGELGKRFGPAVKVRTQYHVQIMLSSGTHDVWFGKFGLKWKLAGRSSVVRGSADMLWTALDNYQPSQTDLAKMKSASELCRQIESATQSTASMGIFGGIFVDAGFKDGKARIGVVKVEGEAVSAIRQPVEAANIQEAERLAIEEGIRQIGITGLFVFSDAKTVVESLGDLRVKWIERGLNKHADKMANLRGVKRSAVRSNVALAGLGGAA